MVEVMPKSVSDVDGADRMWTRWQREKQSRLASQELGERSGAARRGDGWRRTERDELLLQFATLHGMVLLRQAAKWFYGGKMQTAAQRVAKMEQAGLLNKDAGVEEWAGTVLTPTKAGQRVGLLGLPPLFRRLSQRALAPPDNLLHAALVADQILLAQSQGVRVLTERQIRLLDREDLDVVRTFLTSDQVGARFSAGATDPGIRAGRAFRSVPRGEGVEPEMTAYPTVLAAAYPGVKQALTVAAPSSARYPDFVRVIPETGELIAVEVELAAKASDRLHAIVVGYARALATPVPDGRGGLLVEDVTSVDPATGEQRVGHKMVLERRQFRQVQWLCVPETAFQLRGSLDPVRGVYSGGFIRRAMPNEFGPSYDWSRQNRSASVQVHEVVADDSGVQYKLDQRILYPRYRCSYRRWRLWRSLWEDEVPAAHRARATFVRWLSAPGGRAGDVLSNLDLCLQAEQDALNAPR